LCGSSGLVVSFWMWVVCADRDQKNFTNCEDSRRL
jgi:hypothetical protein